jgi:hypothetical protein
MGDARGLGTAGKSLSSGGPRMTTATATRTVKYNRFLCLRPSGDWEAFRAPEFLDARYIAPHRPHSAVCLFIPKGRGVYVRGVSGAVYGPTWALWNQERQEFVATYDDPTHVSHREIYALS